MTNHPISQYALVVGEYVIMSLLGGPLISYHDRMFEDEL